MSAIIRPEPIRDAVLERRIRPLSRTLALALLYRCCAPGPWRIEAAIVDGPAPSSLDELLGAWPGSGPVPVSGANAEHTIWGHPDLNALFRAWHDAEHVRLSAEFTTEGERAVACAAVRLPENVGDADILWVETWGQHVHRVRHGVYPRLQRAFTVCAVREGIESALAQWGRFQ